MSKAAHVDDGAGDRFRFRRDQECDGICNVVAGCRAPRCRARSAMTQSRQIPANAPKAHPGYDTAAAWHNGIHPNAVVQKVVSHSGTEREDAALARAVSGHVRLAPARARPNVDDGATA